MKQLILGPVVYLFRRQWRRSIVFGAIVLLPFALWQIVVWQWFGQAGLGSGGALATPFEIVPLRGLGSLAFMDLSVFLLLAAIMVPLAVIPALISLWIAGRQMWRRVIDIPTLVLSGDLDVATPAFRSQLVVDALPNATHVIFPGHTHVQFGQINLCASDIYTQFIADPEATLDTSCLKESNVVGFLLPDGTFSQAPEE